jgi:hypothetical protein
LSLALIALGLGAQALQAQNDTDDGGLGLASAYAEIVEADKPVAWWRFEEEQGERGTGRLNGTELLPAEIAGPAKLGQPGPRPPKFPRMTTDNRGLSLEQPASLRYSDPGAESPFDFKTGDMITLEAWVRPAKLADGQQVYVIGKGRTGNQGFAADNQNWSLRLAGKEGTCRLSFLFRDADNKNGADDWHRWTSDAGFGASGDNGAGWHHIAVSYTFGKGDSLRGYVDGRPTKGVWDYGGQTDEAPVVDDDQVWIGSALGNNAGNSFLGSLDEIAIYRTALSAERIAARWQVVQPKPYVTNVEIPPGKVLVEVLEGLPDDWNWNFVPPQPSERYAQQDLAFVELPKKYNAHGVIDDRSSPFVLWATSDLALPAGKHRLLLRSRSAARLYIDGKLAIDNPFSAGKTDGHNPWDPVESKISPRIRPLQPGDQEQAAEIEFTGKPVRLRLELFVGGKKRRPEVGETSVAIAPAGSDDFWVLGHIAPTSGRGETQQPSATANATASSGRDGSHRTPTTGQGFATFPLTDEGWLAWERDCRAELVSINQQRRAAASADYATYWQRRHDWARAHVGQAPRLPDVGQASSLPKMDAIDALIHQMLEAASIPPAPLTDDASFLRRLYLDVIGVPPSAEQVTAFITNSAEDKRSRLIDELLQHPGWADNWVGYWQDALAENPNIVNPTLNNTGPFRWWLYEALLDNKPIDRFATELILMEGSQRYGGTAGFGVATENDAPLAAKAQNLGLAFLAFDMRCARCHDAPQHDFKQEDLFNLAAMLHRGEQTLPKTSTIPGDDQALASLIVKVSLKPGQKIQPRWPFEAFFSGELPRDLLFDPSDEREELAFRFTSPQNPRFAKVIVNRLWQRYFGRGIVEPIDDWETARPANPELLDWLARELMTHDYDLKHIARLILNSQAYQRVPTTDPDRARLFAAPLRRRMTAEQVLDSLLAAAGKEMHVEDLNIDVEGTRLETSSISLGRPARAWQFTSMSNERDRPSLSLPAAQTAVNVLEAFGWRSSRQDPLSVRDKEPTVLQPAILANGVVARRAAQLSEDSALTRLALAAETPGEFVDAAFRQIFSRQPIAAERDLFVELLAGGFSERKTGAAPGPVPSWPKRDGVSWSNHLQSKSNEIRLAWQKEVEKGDPPTTQLAADWRERAEDLAWTLFNSPEFVWIP